MVQWLRALAILPEVPSSNPPKHGGSQPYIMGSDALSWHAAIHADRALAH